MLVLNRASGEKIRIGGLVEVTVCEIDRGYVKLGIDAPKSILVDREEVSRRRGPVPTMLDATQRAAFYEGMREGVRRMTEPGPLYEQEIAAINREERDEKVAAEMREAG